MSVYFTAEVCVLEVSTCCKPYSAEWLTNDLMLLASLITEVEEACTQLAFGRVFIWGYSLVKKQSDYMPKHEHASTISNREDMSYVAATHSLNTLHYCLLCKLT